MHDDTFSEAKATLKNSTSKEQLLKGKWLYFGNLYKHEKQYKSEKFIGLSLNPENKFDVEHNALHHIPVADFSVDKVQSQDVFEHIDYEKVPAIFDEIYRVLAPNGIFRLSLPDYRSPVLKQRSIYDSYGNVLGDIRMGAKPFYDSQSQKLKVKFARDGGAHVWFPTFENVNQLILQSELRKSSDICFYHYFINDNSWIIKPYPENDMFVKRAPPHDMRADGKPISIIIDFIK